MKAKGVMLGIGVLNIVLAAVCVYLLLQQDRTAPVITFPEETVAYSETMDKALLLEGVTAWDEADGDVSDSLLIEKIAVTTDGKAIVTYAALDGSNNAAKASRVLPAKEETERNLPEETMEGETGSENESQEQTEVTEETNEEEEAEGGEDQPEEGNQNSREDQSSNNEGREQSRINQPPVLRLRTDTLTIPEGAESVDWNDCIESLSDDYDSRDTLFANLMMDGHVDFTTPGDYPVTLYTRDSDGAESEKVMVTVTVQ